MDRGCPALPLPHPVPWVTPRIADPGILDSESAEAGQVAPSEVGCRWSAGDVDSTALPDRGSLQPQPHCCQQGSDHNEEPGTR